MRVLGIFVLLLFLLLVPCELTSAAQLALTQDELVVVRGEPFSLSVGSVQRLLVGNPSILTATSKDSSGFELTGVGLGKTFVIVWAEGSRVTYPVRVVSPGTVSMGKASGAKKEELEHARALKIEYATAYEHSRNGEAFSETSQNTTNIMNHSLRSAMEVPYGDLSSSLSFRRTDALSELSNWQVRLDEGHWGPIDYMDIIGGDTRSPIGSGAFGFTSSLAGNSAEIRAIPGLDQRQKRRYGRQSELSRGQLAIPSLRYRGITIDYEGMAPLRILPFYGRQRATISPIATAGSSQDDLDSFLSGGYLSWDDPDLPVGFSGTWTAGSGSDRGGSQSDNVSDFVGFWQVTDNLSLKGESAFSEGQGGYFANASWGLETVTMGLSLRHIAEDFENVLGPMSNQGERGLEAHGSWQMLDAMSLRWKSDVFEDRQDPNPAEPDLLNANQSVDWIWRYSPTTSVSLGAARQSLLGTLFGTSSKRWSAGVQQGILEAKTLPLVENLNLALRFDQSQTRNVHNPILDAQTEAISLGAFVPISGGFLASANQQWRLIQQDSADSSRPWRFSAALSHLWSFFKSRLQVRNRVSYQNESTAETLVSTFAGQDRMGWLGGMEYVSSPSLRFYLNGSIDHVGFNGDEESQVDVSVATGAKMELDARYIRWDPSAQVRGAVFHDRNGDGVRQSEEEGIPDVAIIGGLSRKATTDASGKFSIGRLFGKSIPVGLDPKTLPKGYVVSTPSAVVIRPQEKAPGELMFGALGRAEVRGRIFYDVNVDDAYSVGDQGVGSAAVRLGERQTVTDSTGWFFFRDLPGGEYALEVLLATLPTRYVPVGQLRRQLAVEEGAVLTLDIALRVNRALRGSLFLDKNANGRLDRGEPTQTGIVVCLDGKMVGRIDEKGGYYFPEIQVGSHTVTVNCGMPLPAGMPIIKKEWTVHVKPEDPEITILDIPVSADAAQKAARDVAMTKAVEAKKFDKEEER